MATKAQLELRVRELNKEICRYQDKIQSLERPIRVTVGGAPLILSIDRYGDPEIMTEGECLLDRDKFATVSLFDDSEPILVTVERVE